MERENNMAIINLKTKKATFADLESKTLDKIRTFNAKKNDANSAVSEFTNELSEINGQIVAKEAAYKETLDTQLLREIDDLTVKATQVRRLMEVQRKAFGEGNSKIELSDADVKDLTATFAPYRKQELDLTKTFEKQIADLESTLKELDDVRTEYWNAYYAPIFGQALHATGNQFAVHFLRENKSLVESHYKLNQLTHHPAFPKSFYD
jgi:chromosome segregation ATPase